MKYTAAVFLLASAVATLAAPFPFPGPTPPPAHRSPPSPISFFALLAAKDATNRRLWRARVGLPPIRQWPLTEPMSSQRRRDERSGRKRQSVRREEAKN
ncbi:hypothetical protein B0H19DRAFT_95193 [Mycena capillaripes]|nr:hypothetical protein B0H19DRAFT_95193 [Mycena capillaripes]